MGDWEDNPSAERPRYGTQVYTNSQGSDQAFSNWRDDSQQSRGKYDNRNNQRGDRNGFGGGGRGGDRGGPRRQNYDNEDATIIKVPSKFVGRIIGRGGSKINDLQYESGCRINVTKDTDGDQTIVKLIGDSDAVAKAESLIGDLTVEREGSGYGNYDRQQRDGSGYGNFERQQRDGSSYGNYDRQQRDGGSYGNYGSYNQE